MASERSSGKHELSSRLARAGKGNAMAVVPSAAMTPDNLLVPHMFHEIVSVEKPTTAEALLHQVYTKGIFLAGKTKKYWLDQKSGSNCFMLYPRGLSITWGGTRKYWAWCPMKDASDSDTEIEVAVLKGVCWLEIVGRFPVHHLTPRVSYEVIFQVMLNEQADFCEPVNLSLNLPDGTSQYGPVNLQNKPTWQWFDLKVGETKVQQGQMGQMQIICLGTSDDWKSGLVLKGIKILPKDQ